MTGGQSAAAYLLHLCSRGIAGESRGDKHLLLQFVGVFTVNDAGVHVGGDLLHRFFGGFLLRLGWRGRRSRFRVGLRTGFGGCGWIYDLL